MSAQSFMPIAITGVTSVLFLERYDASYAISMLTGLSLFFYFAECIRRVTTAVKTRRVHHYAIPRAAILLYAPSFVAILAAWITRSPRTITTLIAGYGALMASTVVLWVLIWGVSRFINTGMAKHRLFLPVIHYGLNILILLTPIFYPINAVRIAFLRTLLSYNPLTVAIIGTRAAFMGDYSNLRIETVLYTLASATIIGVAGHLKKP